MKSEKKITGTGFYALVFGLFLGLAILKFGNPVILDQKITPPVSPSEFWADAWPTHWGNWILLPLALAGAALGVHRASRAGRERAGSGCCRCCGSAGSFFQPRKQWMAISPQRRFGNLPDASPAISSARLFWDANAPGVGCSSECWRRLPFASFGESTSGCLSSRKAGKCCWKASAHRLDEHSAGIVRWK